MKITPQIFLTSDTHFGHTKLWETWGHRPKDFEETIVENWNSVVGKHDTVLHLGDLTLANKEKTMSWTNRLRGRKYLILGNHDNSSVSWYRDCGFEVIPASFQKFGQKDDSYMKVLFTHEPTLDLPEGWFNIHGHLHGDNHRNIITTPKHYDVGVDANDLKPVRLYDVLSVLKQEPNSTF